MSDNVFLFWVLVALTTLVCVWKVVGGIRTPERVLHWPFLASFMWLYFYVLMAFQAQIYLPEYLPEEWLPVAQLMPLACILGVIWGWDVALRNPPRLSGSKKVFSPVRLWWLGAVLMVVGIVGTYSLARAIAAATAAGERFDWSNATAYWYYLYYIGYPGTALALWATLKLKGSAKFAASVALAALVITAIFPYIYSARRGPLFPLVLILLFLPYLATTRRPRPLLLITGLLLTGVTMFAFVRARDWIYKGGTWQDAFSAFTFENVVVQRTILAADNEYLNNVHMIGVLSENGKFYYGSGHAGLLLHWIPKRIWEGKPALGEGWYTHRELFDDINSEVGSRLIGGGAAAGGVAETFLQYGYFAPFFWFGLSWVMGRVYLRARGTGDPRWIASYVSCLATTHWLVSQSFTAAFVPAMIFQGTIVVAFLLSETAPTTEPGQDGRQAVLTRVPPAGSSATSAWGA